MACRICKSENKKIFTAKVLNKYEVDYFYCSECGFISTEEPYWLKEAYADSINKEDTGYVSRNIILARKSFLFLITFFNKDDSFLDYAGGYGMLTRLMRDMGLNFYWEDKYTKNLFARRFEYNKQKISAITCFECFEHFSSPVEEIEKILSISENIFFSTSLYDANNHRAVPDVSWPYYGFGHGQHISFYSLKTLKYIADKYKLNLYSNGRDLYLFTTHKINRWLFWLVIKLGVLPWDILSRLILKSKTYKDYIFVSNYKE